MTGKDTTPAAEPEIDMLKIAEEADAAPATPETTPAPAQTEPTAPAAAPADTTQQPKADAPKPDATKPEDNDKGTAYEKSKREADRRDKSWKALESEKAEFRAEKARIEAEITALRREVAQVRQPAASTGPAKDKLGLTAKEYDAMAKRFEDEGKDEMAQAARERAEGLRAQPAPAATGQSTDFANPDFQAKWQENVQALIQQDPSLGKPDHPVTKTANLLVNDANYGRFFRSAPDGIKAAVEVARIMQVAQAAQATTAELTKTQAALTKAQAEIDRLTKLTSPHSSPPNGQAPSAKRPEDLNDSEIRALAAAADRGE